jgi:transposase InsO family protein
MLNQEYYNKKNMVGRDKLYFSLRRQYGPDAPSQKAINDWLQQQNVHQVHHRQFASKTITPIRNIKKPNQVWQADLVDMGSKPDNGYKWILTAIDLFSKFAYARPMRNKERRTVVRTMQDILQVAKPRLLQTDNGSEFISAEFQALLRAQNVRHITGMAGRAQSQGSIERFHWTMKSVIGKLWTARSQKRWVGDLQDIVKNYNSNVHLATSVPPAEINRDNKEQIGRLNQRQQQTIDRFDAKTEEKDKLLRQQKVWRGDSGMQRGDNVRLKITKGAIDSATLKPNWSSSIYEIDKVRKLDDKPIYTCI